MLKIPLKECLPEPECPPVPPVKDCKPECPPVKECPPKDDDKCDDRPGKGHDKDHGWKGKDKDDKCEKDDKGHGGKDRDYDKDHSWKGKDKDKDDKCEKDDKGHGGKDRDYDKDHGWKGKDKDDKCERDDKCEKEHAGKWEKCDYKEPDCREPEPVCKDPCDVSDLHGVLASMSDVSAIVDVAIDQLGAPTEFAQFDLPDGTLDSLGA